MPDAGNNQTPSEHGEPEKSEGDYHERNRSPLTGYHAQCHADRDGHDANEDTGTKRLPGASEGSDRTPTNRQTRRERPGGGCKSGSTQPVVMDRAAYSHEEQDTDKIKCQATLNTYTRGEGRNEQGLLQAWGRQPYERCSMTQVASSAIRLSTADGRPLVGSRTSAGSAV
jgi:hypothetical protein